MKEKTFLILVIFSLITINIFILIRFKNLKQQKVLETAKNSNQESIDNDELNLYKVNFTTNILNSNSQLESVTLKDSLNNLIQLKEVFESKQKQILVCRFSQMHCQSCVNSSIQILRSWVDSIGIKNVMFMGKHRNNRIFNRTIPLYGIQGLKIYNVSQMNNPAENLGYPYYFVLDSSLRISNVFVPNKGLVSITNKYLENIKMKFELDAKHNIPTDTNCNLK